MFSQPFTTRIRHKRVEHRPFVPDVRSRLVMEWYGRYSGTARYHVRVFPDGQFLIGGDGEPVMAYSLAVHCPRAIMPDDEYMRGFGHFAAQFYGIERSGQLAMEWIDEAHPLDTARPFDEVAPDVLPFGTTAWYRDDPGSEIRGIVRIVGWRLAEIGELGEHVHSLAVSGTPMHAGGYEIGPGVLIDCCPTRLTKVERG